MGLFDKRDKGKKKKDDFDSPVEQVDLSAARKPAPPAARTQPRQPTAPPAKTVKAAEPAPAKAKAENKPEAPPPRPPEPIDEAEASYSINKAIELMRNLDLPDASPAVIVQVVKLSLESVGVKITKIIEEATAKQKRITDRISVLNNEVENLEKEIATRKGEITRLEADHEETSDVKQRLVQAEDSSKPAQSEGTPPLPNRSGNSGPTAARSLSAVSSSGAGSANKSTVVAKK